MKKNTSAVAPYHEDDSLEVETEDGYVRAVVLTMRRADTSGFGLVWSGYVQLRTGDVRAIVCNDDGRNPLRARGVRPGRAERARRTRHAWDAHDVLVSR